MSVVNPPAFLQNAGATHTAEITRGIINGLVAGKLTTSSLKGRGGVNFDLGGALAVTQNGTPNMTVLVDIGVAYIPGSQGAKQGMYVCTNDASLSVTINTADATNPRIDLIVFKVEDAIYSGAVNSSSIVVVTGTPAGSPAAPAAPNNSLILAQISVPANDTTITNNQITDKRKFLAGAGGAIRCLSTARPASTEVSDGQEIFETDTGCTYKWRSGTSTWQWVGPAGNTVSVTINTGVANESTSSATLTPMAATSSLAFTKLASTTRIMVEVTSSHFGTGSYALGLGVRANSVDKSAGVWNITTTSRTMWNGRVVFTAAEIPNPGAYTAQILWADLGGAGSPAHAPNDDTLTITVTEIAP